MIVADSITARSAWHVLSQVAVRVEDMDPRLFEPRMAVHLALARYAGLHRDDCGVAEVLTVNRCYAYLRSALGGPVEGVHAVKVGPFLQSRDVATLVLKAGASLAFADMIDPDNGGAAQPSITSLDVAREKRRVEGCLIAHRKHIRSLLDREPVA